MLASVRRHVLTATEAAEQLGISRSRFYALSTDYLLACSRKKETLWIPGTSGGDHTLAWPEPVTDLLEKRLACSPPCPYSFAAFRSLATAFLQARPRPGPPLGDSKWFGAYNPAQTPARTSAPLATLPDRRTLAIGRFTPSLVSHFLGGLSHAQYARRLQPLVCPFQTLRSRTPPVLPRFSTRRFPPSRTTAPNLRRLSRHLFHAKSRRPHPTRRRAQVL